jgi:hypothetical protein
VGDLCAGGVGVVLEGDDHAFDEWLSQLVLDGRADAVGQVANEPKYVFDLFLGRLQLRTRQLLQETQDVLSEGHKVCFCLLLSHTMHDSHVALH